VAGTPWTKQTTVSDWIFEENLRGFLRVAAWLVGYAFEEDDWLAIRAGIEPTDDGAGRWFDYELAGRVTLPVALARSDPDAGTGVVAVRLNLSQLNDYERGELAMLTLVMQHQPGPAIDVPERTH